MPRRALTEQERADRQERQRQLAEQSVKQLRDSDGWQRWLKTRKAFRRYSVRNQILIALQCPEATHVAGFRKWTTLGYCVRKGQKGLYIWAPIPPSKKRIADWEAAGKPKDNKPRTMFGLTAVFDFSQVDELPPPHTPAPLDPPIAPITGDELADHLPALIELATAHGYTVGYEAIGGAAQGYCAPTRQHLGVSEDLAPNGRAMVLIHELAHMLVRAGRLDDDPDMDYATEEWVAENVAFMVADTLGLDTADSSVPYLATWAHGRELDALAATAALVDRLARTIEDVVLAADGEDQHDATATAQIAQVA
jgi:antirestriction protein ArdC